LFVDYPVWTGLIALGIPSISIYNLGGGGTYTSYGLSQYPPPADGWGGLLGPSPTTTEAIYGFAVFTAGTSAVPEPSTLALAFARLVVSVAALAARHHFRLTLRSCGR
jgi:hypothetical protein